MEDTNIKSNIITRGDIQQLLLYFSKNTYRAKENDSVCQEVMNKCIDLVSLDYSHVVVNNTNGELSANYPSQLIIMEYEHGNRVTGDRGAPGLQQMTVNSPLSVGSNSSVCNSMSLDARSSGTIYENVYDANKLRDLFGKARSARCRARFPIPVIFFRGKHVCRSATLSGGPEIYGRSSYDYFFSGEEASATVEDLSEDEEPPTTRDWQLFDRVRSQDIRLLQTLNVGTIVDLMVEKKKVKFGMNVTSSEKVDKENRYSDFKIISLPYPGCEFFKEYRDNDYIAKGLVFDWNQTYVDATLGVPDDPIINQLKINWDKYKMWDLVKLTQNYIRLLLRYLVEQSTGILVHCISGWDRTPLFVSLLRLSLWADGAIHQSLNPHQILYFTIAYDWMLFGHNLEDRLSKGEDIFFFCFYIIKHLIGDEFSVIRNKLSSKHMGGSTVLRTDSDSHLEGVLFEPDGQVSSQGSNVSLNSSWSSISSKSQEAPPALFGSCNDDTNGNSLPSTVAPLRRCDKTDGMSCNALFVMNSDSALKNNESVISCSTSSSSSSSSCTERSNTTQASVIGSYSQNPDVPVNNYINSNVFRCTSTSCTQDSDCDCDVHCVIESNGCCNSNVNSNSNIHHRCADNMTQSLSPSKMHTSPVAVPSRTTLRQRNESSSSLSVGSWQFITGTGSLRGSSSNSTCGSQGGSNASHMSLCEGGLNTLITDSTSTLIEDECFIYSNGTASLTAPTSTAAASSTQDPMILRRERLREVRELFYNSYCSTIGLRTKDGSEGGIGHFLGNFAEKVGIRSTQRTSV